MLVSIFLQVTEGALGPSSFCPYLASLFRAEIDVNDLLGFEELLSKPRLKRPRLARCFHFSQFFTQIAALQVEYAVR